jgi:hypothetical protein
MTLLQATAYRALTLPSLLAIAILPAVALASTPVTVDQLVLGDYTFTPDGTRVIFGASDLASSTPDAVQLYEVPITGGTPTQITPPTADNHLDVLEFAVNPTGEYVVYRRGTQFNAGDNVQPFARRRLHPSTFQHWPRHAVALRRRSH